MAMRRTQEHRMVLVASVSRGIQTPIERHAFYTVKNASPVA